MSSLLGAVLFVFGHDFVLQIASNALQTALQVTSNEAICSNGDQVNFILVEEGNELLLVSFMLKFLVSLRLRASVHGLVLTTLLLSALPWR